MSSPMMWKEATMLDPGDLDAIDQFIGEQLTKAGIWRSPRESDGVAVVRRVSTTGDSVHFCGRIYTIDDQREHNFWIEQQVSQGQTHWTLYFDTRATSERQNRDAMYALDRPDEIVWDVTLRGCEAGA